MTIRPSSEWKYHEKAMTMRGRMTIVAGALGLMLAACGKDDSGNSAGGDIAAEQAAARSLSTELTGAADLSTAARLVKAAGLDRTFDGVGTYTLFLPVDAAFSALPADRLKGLETAQRRPQLIALLRAHTATGYVAPADLTDGLKSAGGTAKLASVSGQPLTLRRQGDVTMVGDGDDAARVVGQPIVARNGMIYRIDKVIPPPAR